MYSVCLAGPLVESNGSRKNGARDGDTRDTFPSSVSLARPFLSCAFFARSFITSKRLLRRLGVLKR